MPACEYCGDHFPKGGAHSTHERNCDERSDPGSDGVEETVPIDEDGVTEPVDAGDAGDGGEDEHVLEFSQEEFDEMMETARDDAYYDGYLAGYADAESELASAQADAEASEPAESGEEVELPCQHETFDPAESPHDPPFYITCDTCGDFWMWEGCA